MNIPTLDKCPGYNLYIGGVIALRRPQALRNANITHIVSVLDWKFDDDAPLIRGYQHLHIPVDDVEDENLLVWLPRSNAFIHNGLNYWRTPTYRRSEDTTTNPLERLKESGVLIHCAMGKSRSATVLLAYLLWASRQQSAAPGPSPPPNPSDDPDMISLPSRPLTVVKALEVLRQGRPIAEPNEGFMDQLHMYEAMGCPTTEVELKKHKIYRRWMNKRSVEESLRVNMAPEMAHIKFEDESDDDDDDDQSQHVTAANVAQPNSSSSTSTSTADREMLDLRAAGPGTESSKDQGQISGKGMETVAPGIKAPDGTSSSSSTSSGTTTTTAEQQSPSSQVTIKCRKCRHVLATTPFILTHIPPPHTDPAFHDSSDQSTPHIVGSPSSKCAHVFLHPLSWMRPVLSEGRMEGRLSCPKCNTNIGKFAWTGLRCSCGGWVTPGFGVARGKVDELAVLSGSAGLPAARGVGGGGAAVRLPPGMRRGGGNL